jgi:hypothetical protein
MCCSVFRFVQPWPRLRLGMTPCGRPSLRGGDACLRTVINFGPRYLILILAIGFLRVYFDFAQTRSFFSPVGRHASASHPLPHHRAACCLKKKKKKKKKIPTTFSSSQSRAIYRVSFVMQFRKTVIRVSTRFILDFVVQLGVLHRQRYDIIDR